MRILLFAAALGAAALPLAAQERLRVVVETDAGGDPDDEQSLVRFLVSASEWDVEGLIANRPAAREKENRNAERTGLGIVRAMVRAYGDCHPRLIRHDPRYPSAEALLAKTVPGYDDVDDGVRLLLAAADAPDPRPVWFMNWGTDRGSAGSCLKRALDRVLKERGQPGYEAFKRRFRLSSADKFGDHTTAIQPPFPLWVDTFRPELDRKRWYHRFSAITAGAGGFDVERDVRTGHGPLGALYPTNTTQPQKEGDTMAFLYLFPTGMNDPERPEWGSWGGRYGRSELWPDRPYYWANRKDRWRHATDRENTLRRWALALQNEFRARMDWCVKEPADANHPPRAAVRGEVRRSARSGERVELDASLSSDPDGQPLAFEWSAYPETGTYDGPDLAIDGAASARAALVAPMVDVPRSIHLVVSVTDAGAPPLTRYRRVILTVEP
jgi:hypothetical protein